MDNVTHIRFNNQRRGEDKLLVTHTDLDGVGCAVLFLKTYPAGNVVFASNNKVNDIVMELLADDKGWDILITDLSVNPIVAGHLDRRGKVGLLDHHKSALWMNEKYSWANVTMGKSGTLMLYEFFENYVIMGDQWKEFVDIVDNWDMWGGGEGPSKEAIDMSFLFDFLGRDRFLRKMVSSPDLSYSDAEREIIEIMNEKYERYYQDTVAIMQTHMTGEYAMGITMADQFQSLMGNRIVNELDLEYVMMLDARRQTGSLRGKGNLDLSELAQRAGGGGHPRAAGFPFGATAADLIAGI